MKSVMIILNYKDKERALSLAEKCIDFKLLQKVVIVDNCSPDNSYDWLLKNVSKNDVEIIQSEKNGGFSYGNNFGAQYVNTKYDPDYILFANTDTIFQEEDVEKCLDRLENNSDLGVISMRMININGYEETSCWKQKSYLQMNLFCLWLYRRKNYCKFFYDYKNNDSLQYVDVVRGSFMFFKNDVLKNIHYFDSNTFLYYEEDIICKKVRDSGKKVGILTDAYYIHDHQQSNVQTIEIKDKLDKSMLYFLLKYYKINRIQKIITLLIIKYSRLEFIILNKLKKGGKYGE